MITKGNNFVTKLYRMGNENNDIIRNFEGGIEFDSSKLPSILNNYYNTHRVSSFVRQLNMYNFAKSKDKQIEPNYWTTYYNPNYTEENAHFITRKYLSASRQESTYETVRKSSILEDKLYVTNQNSDNNSDKDSSSDSYLFRNSKQHQDLLQYSQLFTDSKSHQESTPDPFCDIYLDPIFCKESDPFMGSNSPKELELYQDNEPTDTHYTTFGEMELCVPFLENFDNPTKYYKCDICYIDNTVEHNYEYCSVYNPILFDISAINIE